MLIKVWQLNRQDIEKGKVMVRCALTDRYVAIPPCSRKRCWIWRGLQRRSFSRCCVIEAVRGRCCCFFLKWRFANAMWRAWDVYHGLTVLVTGKIRCDHSRDADTLMRLVVGCECALRLMIILGLKTAYSRHKWWKPRLFEKYQLLGEKRGVDAV